MNQRFHQYATAAGFRIRACEGYDPESKGKVEAGVKYVKYNGLYGESFANWSDLERSLADWLDQTANQRIHGSTGQVPQTCYAQAERMHMLPYLTPSCVDALPHPARVTRKADKTGLIAWQSNKYSVPMAYQNARVGVDEQAGQLRISDPGSGELIAAYLIGLEKGQIIKNTHHYRDLNLRIETLENALKELLGYPELAIALCALLKASAPKIYKDQLAGANRVLAQHIRQYGAIPEALLTRLIDVPRLTATGLKDRLGAYQQHPGRLKTHPSGGGPKAQGDHARLARYAALNDRFSGHGDSHVVH